MWAIITVTVHCGLEVFVHNVANNQNVLREQGTQIKTNVVKDAKKNLES